MNVECKIVTDFSGITALEADWKRLWDQAARPEIFNSFDYVNSWWSVRGSNYRVFTPVVLDGPRVIAILPLVICDGTLRFFCHTDSDFSDILCEGPHASIAIAAILKELQKQDSQWDWGVLDNIPEHSLLLQTIRTQKRLPLNVTARAVYICPTLDLHAGDENLYERLHGGKRNKQNERRLQRFGQITFHHLETKEAAREGLQKFFQQHSNRRAIEGPYGQFISESSRKLYADLVERLDLTKELRFSVLRVGEKDIAYHFGFQTKGRMLFFKPTFDVDYWAYSPGKVLLHKLLVYALEQDLSDFDFSLGDEVYKRKFANRIDTNYRMVLTNSRLVSRLKRLQVSVVVNLREAIGSRLLSGLRSFLDLVRDSFRQRPHVNRFLPATAATQYVFRPEGANGAAPVAGALQPAGLSWLAKQSLGSEQFMPLSELQKARESMKEGYRFFYLEDADGLSGGWLKNTDTGIVFSRVRATSRTALQNFLRAAESISRQNHREVAVLILR